MSDDYTKQPPRYEETLYRIAQEALNNIVKHAQAQAATVTLYNDAGSIYLIITDNGVGLSTLVDQAQQVESQPQIKSGAGLGLMTMRERAELLGGTFQLKSASGQGTTVVATIPRSWTKPFSSDSPAFSG
jgi:signal transduction histidine kinase